MASSPQLTAAQWRRIAPILPENRRDRLMISAILFRQFSGTGLRDAAAWFGVTRVRLSEWTMALEADGSLARLMKLLRLKPASRLGSSGRHSYQGRDAKMAAAITAIRLADFREALRR
jgi:hypothetical protein